MRPLRDLLLGDRVLRFSPVLGIISFATLDATVDQTNAFCFSPVLGIISFATGHNYKIESFSDCFSPVLGIISFAT